MTSTILAVLLALQGQGEYRPATKVCNGITGECYVNARGPIYRSHVRPRYSDLLPIVEPLPPLNECERLDGDIVEILCFPEWPNMIELITQDSMRQAEQEEAYRKIGGVMLNHSQRDEWVPDRFGHMQHTCPHGFYRSLQNGDCQPEGQHPEPSVVPAIQEEAPGDDPVVLHDPNNCVDGWISNVLYGNHCASRKYWTCKDKTNVIQVSEDGSGHWCVKF